MFGYFCRKKSGIIKFMKKEKQKWLIVANWKMNPTTSKLAKQTFSSIKKIANKMRKVDTVICPPYIYIENLKTTGHRLTLGSQDIFAEPEGSFTGCVSYLQLKNLGIKYTLVGHSERRKMGETDENVNSKIKASLRAIITPIICIGEEKRDEAGQYLKFLKDQLVDSLQGLPKTSISPWPSPQMRKQRP